jgi:hypothetical protein
MPKGFCGTTSAGQPVMRKNGGSGFCAAQDLTLR